ncbi:hypothetical protein [Rhizobium sp. CSW-27]|uniref:major capsid protein n=1 Tax=Rhizobium sp. CSW-27 TaxID=2839985 RepID=UPI001C017AE2|nr:hypothetical protein [Rhizobium sp. CSW-27]MBT9372555.1 hypothetical protein [Rhizobium sp. CSW-27]
MLYNARRSAGSATKRVEFGYEGKPYLLVQDSLESKLPREYSTEGEEPETDLGARATTKVMNALTLALEYEQAELATADARYDEYSKETLAASDQWTDPGSNPTKIIEHARHAIRNRCGLYPNTLILGPKPFSALKNNAYISDRFRNADIVTAEMLGKLFDVEQVVEGTAMMADQTGTFHDVWGNYAVLGYAPREPNGVEEPSYGYTYTYKGNPFVEMPYWEANTKSWIYGVTYERRPVLSGMEAGFLIINPAGEE